MGNLEDANGSNGQRDAADAGSIDEESSEFELNPLKRLDTRLQELTPRIVVTPALVVINLVVFLIMVAAGVGVLSPNGLELLDWGADYGPKTTGGEWWRLLTSNYLHAGIIHIAFNMWILVDVGRRVERMVGSFGFFVMYTVSGLLGSIASIAYDPSTVSVGASGAVFGIFGCLLGVVVRQKDTLELSALKPIGRNALIFIGYNAVFAFQVEGIDVAAHLGGLAAGFICGLVLALPLEISAKAKRNVRALALIGVGTAVTVVLANVLPGEMADYLGEFSRFVNAEQEVIAVESDAIAKVQSGELLDGQYAEIISERILPTWSEAVERFEMVDLSHVSADQREVHSRLVSYGHLRAEGWQLMEEGLVENDVGKMDSARRKQAEAMAVAKEETYTPPPTVSDSLEEACSGGKAEACHTLGLMWHSGNGTSVDEAKARIYYEKGCNGGYPLACANLGLLWANGQGGPKDPVKARALYEEGCQGGFVCNNLAILWEEGEGGPEDATRARVLYQKACDGGDSLGCHNLGRMWEYGRGGPKDPAKAQALFATACNGGVQVACEELNADPK